MFRRYIYIVLFALVLLAPFVMRRVVLSGRADDAGIGSTGKGVPRLVVVTPHGQDILREFGRAFPAWHVRTYGTPVALDFRSPGATNDIKRLLDATYRGLRRDGGRLPDNAPIDLHVVWGGGDHFFNELKQFEHGSVLQS